MLDLCQKMTTSDLWHHILPTKVIRGYSHATKHMPPLHGTTHWRVYIHMCRFWRRKSFFFEVMCDSVRTCTLSVAGWHRRHIMAVKFHWSVHISICITRGVLLLGTDSLIISWKLHIYLSKAVEVSQTFKEIGSLDLRLPADKIFRRMRNKVWKKRRPKHVRSPPIRKRVNKLPTCGPTGLWAYYPPERSQS